MFTKRLFEENVYQKDCTAQVLHVTEKGVILNQTIFFPTGGGQSCDTGTINNIPVKNVFIEKNIIYHVLDVSLTVGDTVHCTLNWEHRFENMQRHCGEHILSGMFHREYGGINKGFHMGSDYMTIDIDFEDDTLLTMDMAYHVETCTNEVIWSNLPVSTRRFACKEDVKGIPLRKALTLDEEITVVCVGDEKNPSDCVFCCGTHPSTSGQVGLVKIYKVEKNKGMFRVYFEAGKKAMKDYSVKHGILTTLCNKHSATTSSLLDKMASYEEKNNSLKEQLDSLKKALVKEHSKVILDNLSQVNIYEYNDLNSRDAMNIGKAVGNKINGILLIYVTSEKTLLLFSNGQINCGDLVKEKAIAHNGKGGGSNNFARVIFPTESDYINFIKEI